MASLVVHIQKITRLSFNYNTTVEYFPAEVEVEWFDLNSMFSRPGMQTAHSSALSDKTWHRMICILTIPDYPDYLRDLAGGIQEPDWTGVISKQY